MPIPRTAISIVIFECPWLDCLWGSLFHSGHYVAHAHRVSREEKRLKNKKVIYVLASGEGQNAYRKVGLGFRGALKQKARHRKRRALDFLPVADALYGFRSSKAFVIASFGLLLATRLARRMRA